MKYPFTPKSNQKIEIGEYWTIPLDDGEFGFSIFLDLPTSSDRRSIYIGLLDYKSSEPLLPDKKYKILWQSAAHIKTVTECGGVVQGKIAPLTPRQELCSSGGDHCRVLSGFNALRKATKADIESMKVRSTCGYMVPKIMANKYLCHS